MNKARRLLSPVLLLNQISSIFRLYLYCCRLFMVYDKICLNTLKQAVICIAGTAFEPRAVLDDPSHIHTSINSSDSLALGTPHGHRSINFKGIMKNSNLTQLYATIAEKASTKGNHTTHQAAPFRARVREKRRLERSSCWVAEERQKKFTRHSSSTLLLCLDFGEFLFGNIFFQCLLV